MAHGHHSGSERVIPAIVFGAGFGFAAVVQPGPMQAFFLARVAQVGWRRTLPASLAPIVSDGPIAALMLTVLRHVPPAFTNALRALGGLLLMYLAYAIFRRMRGGIAASSASSDSSPRSLGQAVAINLANPGPYLAWSLVLGPEVMRLWPSHPASAIGLIAAFYFILTTGNALTIIAIGGLQAFGEATMRRLVPISAGVLAVLGLYRIVMSVL